MIWIEKNFNSLFVEGKGNSESAPYGEQVVMRDPGTGYLIIRKFLLLLVGDLGTGYLISRLGKGVLFRG